MACLRRPTAAPGTVSAGRGVETVACEAGVRLGWEHYTGLAGAIVGIDRFGASAPYQTIYEKFGVTAEVVAAQSKRLLGR